MNKIDIMFWVTTIGVITGLAFTVEYQSLLMAVLSLMLLYFGYKTMKRWINEIAE